ncbi:MAG: ATP-binding cassette domain-containing protein [Ignavibacteriales bacterium]|nr:ATP-binding cassette domain-containing protein [Ignavibacteriales bacterium]
MKIHFAEIIPIPLIDNRSNKIWPLSIEFECGKNYLITSPSGKGKTTLIHFIYGLRSDYIGKITLDKKNIKKINKIDWAEYRQEKFSIVYQDLRLFQDLTAMENLLLKVTLTNYKIRKDIFTMAEMFGVQDLLNNKCSTLSYGQQQRIAIIRSLLQPFKFLLLDEPFSHLDKDNMKLGCDLISAECARQNASVIVTSLNEEYFFNYEKRINL